MKRGSRIWGDHPVNMVLEKVVLGLKWFAILSLIACPAVAVKQERKAFRDVGLGLLGHVKVRIGQWC